MTYPPEILLAMAQAMALDNVNVEWEQLTQTARDHWLSKAAVGLESLIMSAGRIEYGYELRGQGFYEVTDRSQAEMVLKGRADRRNLHDTTITSRVQITLPWVEEEASSESPA